jgi:hypothetical protein
VQLVELRFLQALDSILWKGAPRVVGVHTELFTHVNVLKTLHDVDLFETLALLPALPRRVLVAVRARPWLVRLLALGAWLSETDYIHQWPARQRIHQR